jgi:3-hydroxyacyl-CoA dehydrogenase/enoyl-CoA hydratase/3-hydroxybutyryl-CoA epimerase
VSSIRYERDAEGIVVLTIDDQYASVNTMNDGYVAAMGDVLDRLVGEVEAITGVVVTSAKRTFFAGADLKRLVQVTAADAPAVFERIELVKAQLRRLETIGRPVVAAVNGSALGSGLEIALACHRTPPASHVAPGSWPTDTAPGSIRPPCSPPRLPPGSGSERVGRLGDDTRSQA